MGIPTFPYPVIAAALADSAVTVTYVGQVESGGRSLHHLRLTRPFSEAQDPAGILAKLSSVDYFVDAQTLLVAKTADLTHPKETLTENYTHEMELEGYAVFSGVAVPTIVREKISGQTVWEFRLSTITFNTDLRDADFALQ